MAQKSSKWLLSIGASLIFCFIAYRYHQIRTLSFNTDIIVSENNKLGVKPIHIKSYPIGIDVQIKNSIIEDNIWQINSNSANYLLSSSRIGENGNIVIYGHNSNKILGPMRWIKIGAKIELTGSNGIVYYYEVVDVDTVDPSNLQYFENKEFERLVLFTCTGFLDSKRFIVIAKRI